MSSSGTGRRDQPAGDEDRLAAEPVRPGPGEVVGDGLRDAEREDVGERRRCTRRGGTPCREQRQHGAFLTEHPADERVDGDQQRELGDVGPQPQDQQSPSRPVAAAVGRGHALESSGGAVRCRPSRRVRRRGRKCPRVRRAPGCWRRSSRARRAHTSPSPVRSGQSWRCRRQVAELDVPASGTCPASYSAVGGRRARRPSTSAGSDERVRRRRRPAAGQAVDAAGQLAGEVVVADLRGLPEDLGGVLVRVADDDERAVGGRQPAEPGRERGPQRDRDGAGDVAGGERRRPAGRRRDGAAARPG